MTTITATTILRSRHAEAPDKILSTLLLRYPRCIHSELMTHRVFSRNAASSRAIPVEKLIKDVEENPFIPIHWGKNQKGMQADEECNSMVDISKLVGLDHELEVDNVTAWLVARDRAIQAARAFSAAGYHKQVVNRLLEPFAHITVLVSATEWDNFLELRTHKDAEPHFQILAKEVEKCLTDESTIQELQPGQWHLPFVEYKGWSGELPSESTTLRDAIKLSVARSGSTSYKTVDGFDMTMERALDIYDKLVTSEPVHASPLEHVAQADTYFGGEDWAHPHQHANFSGFRQYRHMI